MRIGGGNPTPFGTYIILYTFGPTPAVMDVPALCGEDVLSGAWCVYCGLLAGGTIKHENLLAALRTDRLDQTEG